MSSMAIVRPGSISICVCLPLLMPSSPLGRNVSWYFITCGAVFEMRTSDSNFELMPSACATAGMISASGGGVLLGITAIGATLLVATVIVDVGAAACVDGCPAFALFEPNVSVMPPRLVPMGRPFGSATTVSVVPPLGTVPCDGVTVSHGWFGVAVKLWPASAASSGMVYVTSCAASSGTAPATVLAPPLLDGRMPTPMTGE
jgi:hypothetical protein